MCEWKLGVYLGALTVISSNLNSDDRTEGSKT